jgi:hypothetical protein
MATVNYQAMSIDELKKLGQSQEAQIRILRQESRVRAAVLDAKLKLLPVTPTANDQTVLGTDIVARLKALPPDLFEKAKEFFAKGGN